MSTKTTELELPSVLGSKPVIEVQCNGRSRKSVEPPTWQSLSPEWDEDIAVPVTNCDAKVRVAVWNTYRLRETMLGYVEIPVASILTTGEIEPRYYAIQAASSDLSEIGPVVRLGDSYSHRLNKHASFHRCHRLVYHGRKHSGIAQRSIPKIKLGFGIQTKPLQRTREIQMLLEMPFSIDEWLEQSFTWERLAHKLVTLKEFVFAADILMEAVIRRGNCKPLYCINLMTNLATCLRGCYQHEDAKTWLSKALEIAAIHNIDAKTAVKALHEITYPVHAFEKDIEDIVSMDARGVNETTENYFIDQTSGAYCSCMKKRRERKVVRCGTSERR